MKLWKVCKKLCKWGALALCAILALQALPVGAVFPTDTETNTSTATPQTAEARTKALLQAINNEREKNGLLPFSVFPALTQAANKRATELQTSFSHTRPNGEAGFTVLSEAHITYGTAAENLAAGFTDTDAVLAGWLASDGHRANILGDYKHVGIGYVDSGVNGNANGWVLLFVGGCETHTISVTGGSESVAVGTTLADAGYTLNTTCAPHGACTLPLPDGLCTGYSGDGAGRHTVTVTYGHATCKFEVQVGQATTPSVTPTQFSDVPSGAWYADAVYTLVDRGILSGTGANTFSPNGTLTRGMLVTMLGRMAGVDPSAYTTSSFSDVKAGTWYAPYVQWAYEKGIATGYGNGVFAPNASITREQLCVFLVRFAGATGTALPTTGGDGFTDTHRISSWAKDAVSIAAKARLISGYSDGTFRPQTFATRAQTASVLAKFLALQ